MIRLLGNHGQFELNNRGWGVLVMLAWDLGWKPDGTSPPEHWDRIGTELGAEQTAGPLSILSGADGPVGWPKADYVSGRGQLVSAADARSIAGALASIVDDLPTHDPLEGKSADRLTAPGFPTLFVASRAVEQRMEMFGGVNKPGFLELIAFLRAGGFRVW